MARPLRLEFAGGLYHVTSRGNRREDIYFSDADRAAWLGQLEHACERFNWRIPEYCQMTNHFHLVVETPEGNLARGMRQLNGVYTQYVNRTHVRVGHVFQGRYHAILVDRDNYLLQLARYVVLNPVRAGLVRGVGDWRWSSYPATVGTVPAPAWLATDWLLGQFAPIRKRARIRYAEFVQSGVGSAGIWRDLRHQIFLGDEVFVARMQAAMPRGQALDEIPRAQRQSPVKALAAYRSEHREDPRTGMALAYLSGAYSMKAIASEFGVHYTTVSRAVKAFESTSNR